MTIGQNTPRSKWQDLSNLTHSRARTAERGGAIGNTTLGYPTLSRTHRFLAATKKIGDPVCSDTKSTIDYTTLSALHRPDPLQLSSNHTTGSLVLQVLLLPLNRPRLFRRLCNTGALPNRFQILPPRCFPFWDELKKKKKLRS